MKELLEDNEPKKALRIGDYIFPINEYILGPWSQKAINELKRCLSVNADEKAWRAAAILFAQVNKKKVMELFIMFVSELKLPFREDLYAFFIKLLRESKKDKFVSTTMGFLIAHEPDKEMLYRISKKMNADIPPGLLALSRKPLSEYHKDKVPEGGLKF